MRQHSFSDQWVSVSANKVVLGPYRPMFDWMAPVLRPTMPSCSYVTGRHRGYLPRARGRRHFVIIIESQTFEFLGMGCMMAREAFRLVKERGSKR